MPQIAYKNLALHLWACTTLNLDALKAGTLVTTGVTAADGILATDIAKLKNLVTSHPDTEAYFRVAQVHYRMLKTMGADAPWAPDCDMEEGQVMKIGRLL
ncbi:MAG: hypothetical protein U0R19_21580 [Bryobacteraceae bacterium]